MVLIVPQASPPPPGAPPVTASPPKARPGDDNVPPNAEAIESTEVVVALFPDAP